MFTIRISYSTGDSFHTRDEQEEVGHSWKDEKNAEVALKYIREHYIAVQEYDGARTKTAMGKALDKAKGMPWFVPPEAGYRDIWTRRLLVPADDGTMVQIDAFWCGYFESLNSAEVIYEGGRWDVR